MMSACMICGKPAPERSDTCYDPACETAYWRNVVALQREIKSSRGHCACGKLIRGEEAYHGACLVCVDLRTARVGAILERE